MVSAFPQNKYLFLAFVSAFFAFPLHAKEDTSAKTPRTKVTWLSETTAAPKGETFFSAFHFQLEPGWHIYWKNPGDSGEAPKVRWKSPPGVFISELFFPPPEKIQLISSEGSPPVTLVNFGYHRQVAFPFQITVPKNFAENALKLSAELSWLICQSGAEGVCIPEKVALRRTLLLSSTIQASPEQERIRSTLEKLPADFPGKAFYRIQKNDLVLLLDEKNIQPIDFYPLTPGIVHLSSPWTITQTAHGWRMQTRRGDLPPGERLEGLLFSKGNPPPKVFHLVAEKQRGKWWMFLLLAFAGGFLLNLMPCVFPVLSLKILQFVQEGGGAKNGTRKQGMAYSLGVLLSFLAIGFLLQALRSGGRALGWGFQLQEPWFIAALAFLFFLLALSLFGVFEIGTSFATWSAQKGQEKALAGSFGTGILAVAVATPCTAPFMGPALAFALSATPFQTFATFAALGLGMASPYLLLSFFPQWLRKLPKPGFWMITFKEGMGFLLGATVLWLCWLYGRLTSLEGSMALAFALGAAGFGVWLSLALKRHFPKFSPSPLLSGTILFFLVFTPLAAKLPSADSNTEWVSPAAGWQPFQKEKLERLLAEKKPVFVDFTADWCLTCKFNEKTVLENPKIKAKLKETGVILLRADWTKRDAEIARELHRFGREGVPFYLYFPPSKKEPVVLPQLLTVETMLRTLEEGGKP